MDGTLALKKYNVVERIEALEEGGSYVLPVASANTLGGVKIGEGLSITEGGVLSAAGGGFSSETLYSNSASNTTCALSKPITDYKMICIRFLRTNNLEVFNTYTVDYLLKLLQDSNSTGVATNDKWCFFKPTDASTLVVTDYSDLHIYEVYGVKFEDTPVVATRKKK